MMTEDDARTKWCPMARVAEWRMGKPIGAGKDTYSASHNRLFTFSTDEGVDQVLHDAEGTYCIASGCMMWRWRIDATVSTTHGYCGLASRPDFNL